jgi:hypothetical protein
MQHRARTRRAGEGFNRVAPRKLKPRLGEFAQHEGKLPFLFGEIESILRALVAAVAPAIDRLARLSSEARS